MDAAPGPLEGFDAQPARSIAGDRKQKNSHEHDKPHSNALIGATWTAWLGDYLSTCNHLRMSFDVFLKVDHFTVT